MKDFDCPYCHTWFEYRKQYSFNDPMEQDEQQEIECKVCEKTFKLSCYYLPSYTTERIEEAQK